MYRVPSQATVMTAWGRILQGKLQAPCLQLSQGGSQSILSPRNDNSLTKLLLVPSSTLKKTAVFLKNAFKVCVVLLMFSVKSLHSKSSPITMTRREVVFVIVNVLTEKTNGESGFWVEIESSFLNSHKATHSHLFFYCHYCARLLSYKNTGRGYI